MATRSDEFCRGRAGGSVEIVYVVERFEIPVRHQFESALNRRGDIEKSDLAS